MKILEICPFSAGICGVWTRVRQESQELSKLGHEVVVFSSNLEPYKDKIINSEEKINNIHIYRFGGKNFFFNYAQDLFDRFFLSKNVTYFNFKKQLEIFRPDLVITHLFHPHSLKALKICNKLNIPIFLVTHAPFNVERKFPLNLITKFWNWRNKSRISKFNKIIAITKWEIPYLEKLNITKDKISYIPNGIPEEFFKQEKTKEQKKVLFLGRITPIKNLETLIDAARRLPKIKFSLVGFAQKDYLEKLKTNLPENVEIKNPVYDIKEKIKLIDEHKIFVLPSKREAMPQSLIEAMSRGKIVISSNTDGGKEIIEYSKNGFLFEIGNAEQLVKLIQENLNGNRKIQLNAKKSSKKYSWKKLIKGYEKLIKK